MDLVKINGIVYDVIVTAIEENPEIVEGSNSGTALYRQRDIRDIVGVKYSHKITFSPNDENPELFDTLFSDLFDNVRESVFIEVVHGQTTISYEARYSTSSRRVNYISKIKDADTEDETDFIHWDDLTIEFRSIETVINALGVQ